MYEIYNDDVLLFTTSCYQEADYYRIEGYIVKKI